METTTINGVQIIRGLDIEEYHKSPILSASKIQYWREGTPRRWKAKYVDGAKDEREADHFIVGRAIDTFIFDGKAAFLEKFCTCPKEYPAFREPNAAEKKAGQTEPIFVENKPWNLQAKYCQSWQAEREQEGRSVLKVDQMRMVKAMAAAILENPFAKDAILHPDAESQVTLRWQVDGIWLQARPDVVNFGLWDWHDLKSIRDIASHNKHFAFMGYDMQAGLVWDALRRIRGAEPRNGTHILVEKSFYPDCRVRDIFGGAVGSVYMEWGYSRAMRYAAEIERARQTGDWTSPQADREPLVVPEWIQRKMSEGEELEPDEQFDTDAAGERLAQLI